MNKEIEKWLKQIATIQAKIVKKQMECEHNNYPLDYRHSYPKDMVEVEYRSNTGNYDPSSDTYWINCDCILCGDRWTIYS